MHQLTLPFRRRTWLEIFLIVSALLFCWLPASASSAAQELVLRGSVRDLQGEPLAGATVRLLPVRSHYWAWFGDFPPEPVAVSRSRGDGTSLINAPAEGLWTLAVDQPGKAPMRFELQALLDDLSVPEIVLQAVKTLRLRAANPSGRPIRDAWILPPEPYFSEPPPYSWQAALEATRTGRDGMGGIRVPEGYLPRSPWTIEHPLHQPEDIDLLDESSEAVQPSAEAAGHEGSWVAVEHRTAAAARGFLLVPPKHRAPISQVEDDGKVWLPGRVLETLVGSPAVTVLSPEKGRLGPARWSKGPQAGQPTKGHEKSETYRLSLPEARVITGEVRDRAAGKAIPGAFVWLARDRGLWTQTDENGVWHLPVGQGEALVFGVDARGYLPRTSLLDSALVDVSPGANGGSGSRPAGDPGTELPTIQMSSAASLKVIVKGAG